MKKRKQIQLLLIFFLLSNYILLSSEVYVTTKAKKGDGVTVLLNRFHLPVSDLNIELFNEINPGKFDKYGGIMLGYRYNLPILKIKYNGKSIESTIPVDFSQYSNEIIEYNKKVESTGLKADFKIDRYIWLPIYLNEKSIKNNVSTNQDDKSEANRSKSGVITEPLFGKAEQHVKITSNDLEGYTFYLVSGHGGPDPGAIGYKNKNELTEDEYGYDITLRLARNLMSYSAKVYMIIQDSSDGIRNDYYLKNNINEIHINGDTISHIQKTRLTQRADIINKISDQVNDDKQFCFILHVDSRATKKRIDIFFYYQDGNTRGKNMANTIYKTIKRKYDKNQPGRGYTGSVTTRNLFMLRNVNVPTVYIELGNIQNPLDQVRFLDPNNRQAIANWLRDGIVNYIK